MAIESSQSVCQRRTARGIVEQGRNLQPTFAAAACDGRKFLDRKIAPFRNYSSNDQ
jgi:hypothetical protein